MKDHFNDERIGNQLASLHVPLGLSSQLGSSRQVFAQNVAGRDLLEAKALVQQPRLGAFSGARRAKKNYTHRVSSAAS